MSNTSVNAFHEMERNLTTSEKMCLKLEALVKYADFNGIGHWTYENVMKRRFGWQKWSTELKCILLPLIGFWN